jgi:pimeloyl-ACP methyl ester carboxylesterase
MPEIYDHAGDPVRYGRARVNGIRMHYVTAGQGEPLLLLHGTPRYDLKLWTAPLRVSATYPPA